MKYERTAEHKQKMREACRLAYFNLSPEKREEIRLKVVAAKKHTKLRGLHLVKITCVHCGTEKQVFPCLAKRKYCSRSCYQAYRDKFQNGCAYTTKENPYKGKKHTLAEREKMSGKVLAHYKTFGNPLVGRMRPDLAKEKNPNWKGGIAHRKRGNDWPTIRREVLMEAGNTCAKCGIVSESLHVHHLVPYSICKRNDKWNLVALCNVCHCATERKTERFLRTGSPIDGLGLFGNFWNALQVYKFWAQPPIREVAMRIS